MTATYVTGRSGDTLTWQGNLLVEGSQVFENSISITATTDTGIDITGAIVTGISIAGSAMTTGISIGITGVTYATGISIGVTGSTLTAGIAYNGTVTTALDFTGLTSTNGKAFSTSGGAATSWAGRIKVLDASGNPAWINIYSISNEA